MAENDSLQNELSCVEGFPKGAQISVVMPFYNAAHYLERSLPPLLEMCAHGDILEVIAVDDGSTDSSTSTAAGLGAKVVSSDGGAGPGAARNSGASNAHGAIVWFVDSDVVVHPEGPALIRNAFEDATVVAVFGSYDAAPPERNFASQYKNLVHHYYHQKGRSEASTFWAGCGAVRKRAFLEVGGFDVEQYKRPSIEDIELGHRLRAQGGRILLLHELRGTHLKKWTIWSIIYTDVIRRAVPWSRLMLTRVGLIDDLNLSRAERLRAAFAGFLFLSCLLAALDVSLLWVVAVMLAGSIAINWSFFSFLRRCNGSGFAILGLLFHQFYYLYGSAAIVWCWIEFLIHRLRRSVTAKR